MKLIAALQLLVIAVTAEYDPSIDPSLRS
jgi:hypothetical protein